MKENVSLLTHKTKVHDWTSCNFTSFNETKCKLINGTVLETVMISTFKISNTWDYLYIIIPSDLSWTSHTQKTRKILGLWYRRYSSPTASTVHIIGAIPRRICCVHLGSPLATGHTTTGENTEVCL